MGKMKIIFINPIMGTFTGSGKDLTEDDLREFECRINNKGIPLNGATYKCGNELGGKERFPQLSPRGDAGRITIYPNLHIDKMTICTYNHGMNTVNVSEFRNNIADYINPGHI